MRAVVAAIGLALLASGEALGETISASGGDLSFQVVPGAKAEPVLDLGNIRVFNSFSPGDGAAFDWRERTTVIVLDRSAASGLDAAVAWMVATYGLTCAMDLRSFSTPSRREGGIDVVTGEMRCDKSVVREAGEAAVFKGFGGYDASYIVVQAVQLPAAARSEEVVLPEPMAEKMRSMLATAHLCEPGRCPSP